MATVNLEISPWLEKRMIDTFDIEVEIMQGSREVLPDGRVKIEIEVHGEKAAMLKDFVLMMMGLDQFSIQNNSNQN